MKKWMMVSIVIGLVLTLTACGSIQSSSASATSTIALSMEGRLLVGTIKLETTSLAVNSQQADQLLPLWETLQSLASSSTAASQEVDAVVSQIESTMSADQISSINALDLGQQDLAAAIMDTGSASKSASTTSSTNASSTQSQVGAGVPGAGNPGNGNPPTDMGSNMAAGTSVQSVNQSQTGTTQAVSGQSTGATNQVSAALINALVELLRKKIA